jgi:predicted RNase H-like HicB family nuclease
MPTKSYLAVVDRAPGETNWSITFPNLPGVTSAADKCADVLRQAKDFLASTIEDLQFDGEPLPPTWEDDSLPDFDRASFHDPRLLLVPIDLALRVNVSIEEGLLARIDDLSRRTGLTRSSLLAKGARMVIATEMGG